MKVNITGKNYVVSDQLRETIEKKFKKLGKYFSDDITANVMMSSERGRQKLEATINARGMIFRAEEKNTDELECVDRVVDKLSTQMSRFKTKIQRKYKGNEIIFEDIPAYDEEGVQEEMKVVKTKKFDLTPMSIDEAIMQMELLEHTFFVFMNAETNKVNVVYKRSADAYGLLETVY